MEEWYKSQNIAFDRSKLEYLPTLILMQTLNNRDTTLETTTLDNNYNKENCRFTISKEIFGYTEAKGNLDIINGKLSFKNTDWPLLPKPNNTFLEEKTTRWQHSSIE
mgnify:FL=1